jgi:hypothetical protein
MGTSGVVTDISEPSLPDEQVQMIRVLIKRMLTEANPEKLRMITEQIRRMATVQSETEQTAKAA